MRKLPRPPLVWFALVVVCVAASPFPILAQSGPGRLEGLLIDPAGRTARGYQVHLIDREGQAVARSTTDDHGVYSFGSVSSGEYSLGIESPDGQVAPVAVPPIHLGEGQLARRDIKLLQGSDARRDEILQGNHGLGVWWAGLSTAGKVWTVLGITAILGITVAALDDDDDDLVVDDDGPVSPYLPGR